MTRAVRKEDMMQGYDGSTYKVGDRVEVHPGCDAWMRGARFGVVIGTSQTSEDRVRVRLDKMPGRVFAGPADRFRLLERAETFGDMLQRIHDDERERAL